MMPNLFRTPRGADFTPDRAFHRIKDYFAAPSAPGLRLVMDVSTAMRWIGRNAVGIVRTEREIAKHLVTSGHDVELVYYDRDNLEFRVLTEQQWADLLPEIRIYTRKRSALPNYNALFLFRDNDILVSAGLQWDIEFLNVVYRAKKSLSFKVIQLIYDLIPIEMPEYCAPGMDVLFPRFIMDTVWTADVVYAISESTKTAFVEYAKTLKAARIPPVRRIRLGCDIPQQATPDRGFGGLQPGRFVLYVSTIEPRKNHRMLFDIWRLLSKTLGDKLPKLVLVGNKGWNTENFIANAEACLALYPDKIAILESVTDEELNWMYSNAYFTVYPSLHEGWGLPIAESLARGTPCIASASSSMPEAADTFCQLIDPYDFVGWKTAIEAYLTQPHLVAEARETIGSSYRTVTWDEAIRAFIADLTMISNRMVGRA